jgi:hypothetical protein
MTGVGVFALGEGDFGRYDGVRYFVDRGNEKRLVLRTNSPRDARGVPFDAPPCGDLLRAGSSTPLRSAQDDSVLNVGWLLFSSFAGAGSL